MFSTLPVIACNFRPTPYYAPQVSSPLSSSPLQPSPPSPGDGNPSQQRRLPISSPTPSKSQKGKPYTKRVTFSNPLIHDRDDGREARRSLFLKKVREGSQDRRWNARGGDDEMMRIIWIAEQRRLARHKAREATNYVSAAQEEPERDVGKQTSFDPSQTPEDEEMVDEVARFEDAEIAAASLSAPKEENYRPYHPYEKAEKPYCSDDDEYDGIFLEVMEEVEKNAGVEEHDRVFQEYHNEGASMDGKHMLVETNKADHDMMDMT